MKRFYNLWAWLPPPPPPHAAGDYLETQSLNRLSAQKEAKGFFCFVFFISVIISPHFCLMLVEDCFFENVFIDIQTSENQSSLRLYPRKGVPPPKKLVPRKIVSQNWTTLWQWAEPLVETENWKLLIKIYCTKLCPNALCPYRQKAQQSLNTTISIFALFIWSEIILIVAIDNKVNKSLL